jgi:tol-pal system protein YbgF
MNAMTRAFCLLFLCAGLAFGASPAALAQAPTDGTILKARIDKLEQEIRTLQRAAAQGRLTTASNAASPATTADQTRLLADMEVRLGKIEAELRSLTGDIEELTHRQDEVERKFELFRQDVQMQLSDQTGGPASNAAAAGTSGLVATQTPGQQEAMVEANNGPESGAPAIAAAATRLSLPEGSVKDQYDFALSFLRKGDYQSAEKLFESFLALHSDHALAGNAQYWLGETYYVRQNYPQAAQAFLTGFQKYPQGAKGPDNLLKLGLSLAAMGQTKEACSAFAELKVRYPNAPTGISARIGEEKKRLECQP